MVELLQEVRTLGANSSELRPLIQAELLRLAGEQRIEFFLDEFAAAKIQPLTLADGLARLNEEATWDMHNESQLHVCWCGST